MNEQLIAPVSIATTTTFTAVIAQLSSTTTITVGEALTVFVFVASLVAWLSRKLQKIEDDIQDAKRDLTDLRATVARHHEDSN